MSHDLNVKTYGKVASLEYTPYNSRIMVVNLTNCVPTLLSRTPCIKGGILHSACCTAWIGGYTYACQYGHPWLIETPDPDDLAPT